MNCDTLKIYVIAMAAVGALVGTLFPAADAEAGLVTFKTEPGVDRPGGDYRSVDLNVADYRACQSLCTSDEKCRAYTYVMPGVQQSSARCYLKGSIPPPKCSGCCVSGYKDTRFGDQPQLISCGSATLPDPSIFRRPTTPTRSSDLSNKMPISRIPLPGPAPEPVPAAPGGPLLPPVSADPTSPQPETGGASTQVPTFTLEEDTNRPGGDYRRVPLDSYDVEACQAICAGEEQCQVFTLVNSHLPNIAAICYLKKGLMPPRHDPCCITGIKINPSQWWGNGGSQSTPPTE